MSMVLDKKQMTEEDIKLQYITPAITSKWNLHKITMETQITDGIANASVQSFVSFTVLRNYLFPLPPLVEQKRIVARLEELLPLCERLK